MDRYQEQRIAIQTLGHVFGALPASGVHRDIVCYELMKVHAVSRKFLQRAIDDAATAGEVIIKGNDIYKSTFTATQTNPDRSSGDDTTQTA